MDLANGPKRRKFFMPSSGFTNIDFLSNNTKPVSLKLTKDDKSHSRKKLFILASVVAVLIVVASSIVIPLILLTQNESSTVPSKPNSKFNFVLLLVMQFHFILAKLLIASGQTNDGKLTSVCEIVDLRNDTLCEPWPNLKIPVKGATGGFLQGGLLICGGNAVGSDSDWNLTNQCQHIKLDGTYTTNTNLSFPLIASSSTVINDRLLVTGGVSPNNVYGLNHVEFIDPDQKSTLTHLPYKVADHCVLSFDSTVMVTGGIDKETGSVRRTTYKRSISEEDNWTIGPDMIEGRTWHGCGSFILNGTVIPVVAGSENTNTLKTVELLDQTLEKPIWVRGPDLLVSEPFGEFNRGHHIVSNGETLYYINTIQPLFLRLECSSIEDCHWIELNRELLNPRNAGIVALVPDELTDCSGNQKE